MISKSNRWKYFSDLFEEIDKIYSISENYIKRKCFAFHGSMFILCIYTVNSSLYNLNDKWYDCQRQRTVVFIYEHVIFTVWNQKYD